MSVTEKLKKVDKMIFKVKCNKSFFYCLKKYWQKENFGLNHKASEQL